MRSISWEVAGLQRQMKVIDQFRLGTNYMPNIYRKQEGNREAFLSKVASAEPGTCP
jgi:hypothetical protein